ncbi:hypothetical protein CALVIDRAFT_491381 [Calocera viscosa TUFC12733]|uniref:Cyclase n=1 Tax=Calocera viscosa (strain TUFC12733) TaxID=1330018 RepID=A0A167FSD1_CALVF|nr:hypothetical protein CALVIDRAFT_491381 [Calocera viscosa TUFC12733]
MPTVNNLPSFEDSFKFESTFWGPKGSEAEGRGMLNLLTPQTVLQAKEEIQDGQTFGLNWDLNFLEYVAFGRQPFEHEIHPTPGWTTFDDVYHFNPQQSSQWDGFRHWGNTKTQKFYSGITKEEILDKNCTQIGIGHWAQKGIVGRGVLLDYVKYAAKHNLKYDVFSNHAITTEVVQAMAAESNVEFRAGDILLVHVGFTEAWRNLPSEIRQRHTAHPTASVGLEQSEKMLRFLWENHFAAVASDSIGVEVSPAFRNDSDYLLHDHCLALWGIPLGELWFLETLAEHCAETGRYTCFLASAPFNCPTGVSSTPNVVATT